MCTHKAEHICSCESTHTAEHTCSCDVHSHCWTCAVAMCAHTAEHTQSCACTAEHMCRYDVIHFYSTPLSPAKTTQCVWYIHEIRHGCISSCLHQQTTVLTARKKIPTKSLVRTVWGLAFELTTSHIQSRMNTKLNDTFWLSAERGTDCSRISYTTLIKWD